MEFINYIYEVDEVPVLAIHQLRQALGAGVPDLAPAISDKNRLVVVVEEYLASGGTGKHRPRWYTLHLHNHGHVLFFILTREQGVTNKKLIENTTVAPHIDGCRVGNAKYDLWCAVEAGLNVSVDLLVLKAAATKINNFDP